MSWGGMDFTRDLMASLPEHMRPKGVLHPHEGRQKADPLRRKLFADWHRLQDIVLAHEETIQRRWKKRTAVKRKQVLLEVNPTLPKEHAPEISALSERGPTARQERRNDFLLPYLNLEDLSINNGTQFLGLLHARAHQFPSEFAWFDSNTLGFGVVAGGVDRYHALDCAMVAFGDEVTYGKVLEYGEPLDESDDSGPNGSDMEFLLRESMTFGDGLAVLEAQAQLTTFLLGVVSKIVVDLDLTQLTPSGPLPAPVIPLLNTELQWQSSARRNAMRPYGPPPVFDIDDIAVLMDAQYELSVQHLGDLRTDPMYFADTTQSYYDHRIERILSKAPSSLIETRAVSMMLSDAYGYLALYYVAKEVIKEFRIVQAKYPDGPARARDLPKDYEDALRRLYPILGLIEAGVSKTHHQTICASAALRGGLTIRSVDPQFAKHEMAFARKPDDKLYTFMAMLLQEREIHLWKLSRIFDQLDRITSDPADFRRVSPLIGNILSQWGVVNDSKAIMDSHRPAVEDNEDIATAAQKRLQDWLPLIGPIVANGASAPPSLAAKAFPISNLIYPKGPRDTTWAAKCKSVDSHFAAFWKAADRVLVQSCGQEFFALTQRLTAPFAVAPTNWASLVGPKVVPKAKVAPVAPFGGAEQSAPAQEPSTAAKAKPKTRGVAAIPAEGSNEPDAADAPSIPPPTPVSPKVYKVFLTLFNAAKDEEVALQQSSVAWKDIQTAFAQIGFELRKTRGSAWTFRHPDGPKTVTVHEPHPDSTMRFWDARRFGRRLTQRFGWTLESFVSDSAVA